MGRLSATSWNLLALGALLAGWRERWVRRLALPLAAVSLLANPYDFYAGKLTGLFSGSLAQSLVLSSLDALFVGLLLLVLHRGAPLVEAAGGWERASRALDRTARALSARLWISASSITLAMISFGSRDSEGLAKLWMVAVPLGAVAANLFVVSGVFGVGGLTVAEAPRRALHAAGALLMMGTILSAMQMFHLFHKWPDGGVVAKQLPLATPILSALALCVFAEALSRIAALLPWLEFAERAAASKRLVILSQLVLVGVQYSMTSSPMREPSSYVGLLMITVGALSITLVSQARLCRALAAEIRERNELPAAVVISS